MGCALLQRPFPLPGAFPFGRHHLPEDRLVTLAYPDQNPRFVSGRFVQYATDGRLAGTALLEMYEGDNRFAMTTAPRGTGVRWRGSDCSGY